MITAIKRFVNENRNDIILALVVILISLLSFALGFIFSEWSEKEEIRLEKVDGIKISLLNESKIHFELRFNKLTLIL